MKEHKFFERYLSNDLDKLSSELTSRYELITTAKLAGITPNFRGAWESSGSLSTVKWQEYNVFQFHIPEIHSLYKAISDMVKEACEYYEIDFNDQQYMVQGWFNINHANVGKLDWHDHAAKGQFAPYFHGYYCVKAEPSITQYRLFDKEDMVVDNVNKNNRAIVSEMGHPHAMGDWSWEGPRITVAYDILPLRNLIPTGTETEQHWIPLL
jgi:hypothetical protein